MRQILPAFIFVAASLAATPAFAHTGHGSSGFAAGLVHPFNGLDHLLVMIGVGLWAMQLGGRNLWLVPLAFMVTMAIGAASSLFALPLPQVELGIAGSVVVIGLLVAFGAKLPSGMAATIVALLSFFHGHAHGSELPEAASALGYGLGFMISTAILHSIGLGLGSAFARLAKPMLARGVGFLAAILGGALLAGF
ncbi:HupE/UreJ family protein [Dongia sp.]|uniref:HupE/UreJ family protein n=1 Tax=Dongia sp. TaxID=1977262 RepID=UPI0035B4F6A6